MTNFQSLSLVFEIKKDHYSTGLMDDFSKKINAKDLLVINSSANDNWYTVYTTKMKGRFHLLKGSVSLAKKLRVPPSAVDIVPSGRTKMPDGFFLNLDMEKPIENQVLFKYGKYAEKHAIKKYIEGAMEQKKQKRVVESITKQGSLNTCRDGIISVGQLKSAKYLESQLKDDKDKKKRMMNDVEKNDYIYFTCFRTGQKYKITSEKEKKTVVEEEEGDDKECYCAYIKYEECDGTSEIKLDGYDDDDEQFVKKKHYYFYSTSPGYGKTTFAKKLLKRCNAEVIGDAHNWMGAGNKNLSENAQFLIIDEYGPKKSLSLDDLKSLTSGDASIFAGNRKSYGGSYRPRSDAQVIIFSNYHLFDVMGKNRKTNKGHAVRKITQQEADILRDRFFIYKLDEDPDDSTTSEDFDACRHIIGHNPVVLGYRESKHGMGSQGCDKCGRCWSDSE